MQRLPLCLPEKTKPAFSTFWHLLLWGQGAVNKSWLQALPRWEIYKLYSQN